MSPIVRLLWLIPLLPALAAGISAFFQQRQRRASASIAILAMAGSLALSLAAFVHALSHPAMAFFNFPWLQFGSSWIELGWLLDPLAAIMLVMVTLVGLLIFIYSTGYMAHDHNFTRFFCFLSLFAAAMLSLILANSLLLLFMCWELVGLASYLLIGFWFHKPEAVAAAQKAFLTTRIGDLGFFLGMVWLYQQTGTLLLYNHGAGCLEHNALSALVTHSTVFGMAVSTAISLLLFCGAAGKSGQFPLHIWLPDAMEGPTPVSALIHAATMVAAGVYLIARVYPLVSATANPGAISAALEVIAWVGAITALFAACIAVAQNDIKRILAYSTISQLGYMMLGLGVGGVAVGMFHLITHAFFKALLFLGAGSVIHGCTEEQDIRNMGGLRRFMPITFATYAIGTLALCGFPLFSGFWSKDEILHAAHGWPPSSGPFYLGAAGAFLTAFYMTRQVYYVFFGPRRAPEALEEPVLSPRAPAEQCVIANPHESPAVMTTPLVILGAFAALLGFVGTPAWPWFSAFLEGGQSSISFARFASEGILPLMIASSFIVFAGLAAGWFFYGRKPIRSASAPDALETLQPALFHALERRLYVDEFYRATFVRWARFASLASDFFDRWILTWIVRLLGWVVYALGYLDKNIDAIAVNGSFEAACLGIGSGGRLFSLWQNGRVQSYLRSIAAALVVFAILLFWWRAR